MASYYDTWKKNQKLTFNRGAYEKQLEDRRVQQESNRVSEVGTAIDRSLEMQDQEREIKPVPVDMKMEESKKSGWGRTTYEASKKKLFEGIESAGKGAKYLGIGENERSIPETILRNTAVDPITSVITNKIGGKILEYAGSKSEQLGGSLGKKYVNEDKINKYYTDPLVSQETGKTDWSRALDPRVLTTKGLEMGAQMGPGLLGGPAGIAGYMGLQEKSSANDDYLAKIAEYRGVTVDELGKEDRKKANDFSTLYGIGSGILESIIPTKALKRLPIDKIFKSALISRLAKAGELSLKEGATEATQGAFMDTLAYIGDIDKDFNWREFYVNRKSDFVEGMAGSGVFSAIGATGKLQEENDPSSIKPEEDTQLNSNILPPPDDNPPTDPPSNKERAANLYSSIVSGKDITEDINTFDDSEKTALVSALERVFDKGTPAMQANIKRAIDKLNGVDTETKNKNTKEIIKAIVAGDKVEETIEKATNQELVEAGTALEKMKEDEGFSEAKERIEVGVEVVREKARENKEAESTKTEEIAPIVEAPTDSIKVGQTVTAFDKNGEVRTVGPVSSIYEKDGVKGLIIEDKKYKLPLLHRNDQFTFKVVDKTKSPVLSKEEVTDLKKLKKEKDIRDKTISKIKTDPVAVSAGKELAKRIKEEESQPLQEAKPKIKHEKLIKALNKISDRVEGDTYAMDSIEALKENLEVMDLPTFIEKLEFVIDNMEGNSYATDGLIGVLSQARKLQQKMIDSGSGLPEPQKPAIISQVNKTDEQSNNLGQGSGQQILPDTIGENEEPQRSNRGNGKERSGQVARGERNKRASIAGKRPTTQLKGRELETGNLKEKQETKIGQVIVDLMKQEGFDIANFTEAHARIKSDGYEDLVFETIGDRKISLAHYYTQNGDMMLDPEVIFEVKDGLLIPKTFQSNPNVMAVPISKHDPFLDMWAGNIRSQGFIKKKAETKAKEYKTAGEKKDGRGILDEYFTPKEVIEKTTDLAFQYSKIPVDTVLEPSAGTGNFIAGVRDLKVTAFEINQETAKIAQERFPNAEIINEPIESLFIDDRGNKKQNNRKWDMVIGNPPYGSHRKKYAGLGEEPRIKRYEEYFLLKALELTNEGGVVAMVVPSGFLRTKKSIAKEKIARLGILVDAYRLPNGIFKGTDVGTDIVVFEKNTLNEETTRIEPRVGILLDDIFFDDNPSKVLGTEVEVSGRFGMEKKIKGDISAVNKIKTKKRATRDLETGVDYGDDLNDDPSVDTFDSSKVKPNKELAKEINKKVVLVSGKKDKAVANIYPLNSVKNKDLWKNVSSTGEIADQALIDNNRANLSYYKNGYYISDLYYSGDIYSKLEQLESDKRYIDNEQYEKQKAGLEAVLPKKKTVNDVSISPNSDFAKEIKFGEKSMIDIFREYVDELPYDSFEGSSRYEVLGYVDGMVVNSGDKIRNTEIRKRRRRVAKKFFDRFVKYEITNKQRAIIEDKYNKSFNSYVKPDYSKVPLFGSVSKTFKGDELVIKPIQLEGASFISSNGVGLLGYDVGVGKTLTAIISINEMMERGWSKRPLVIVPNSVYANWIEEMQELLPNTKINSLQNLGGKFKGDLGSLEIEDGTISIASYEALNKLGFKDETYAELTRNISDVMVGVDKMTEREKQAFNDKVEGVVGKAKRKTLGITSFEDLGFDHVTIDEISNFKNIFTGAKIDKGGKRGNEYRNVTGTSSARGLKAYFLTQYILSKNNGRNVLGLSATPFTNNPLEIYSIISLFGKNTLEKMGLKNVNTFMNTFVELKPTTVVKADNTVKEEDVIEKFYNLGELQRLVTSIIDFRTGEEAGVKRPNKLKKKEILKPNERQVAFADMAQELFADKKGGTLKAIGELQNIALSPYLSQYNTEQPSYTDFVENSPKIKYALESIRKNKESNSEAGQLIYMPRGLEYFGLMVEYLEKNIGFSRDQIGILRGGMTIDQKQKIKNKFNTGEIKVLIGTETMKEGVNLQEKATDLYHLHLPWNPTDIQQVEGRIWRQGNMWKTVRINYPLVENIVDSFIFQKLETKEKRIKNLWSYKGNSIQVGDLDFESSKFDLITDPIIRAKTKNDIMAGKLTKKKQELESELSLVRRRVEKIQELQEDLRKVTNDIGNPPGYWEEDDIARANERKVKIGKNIKEELIKVEREGFKDLDNLILKRGEIEGQIKEVENEQEAEGKKAKERIESATKERVNKVSTTNNFEDIISKLSTENESFFERTEMKSIAKVADKFLSKKEATEVVERLLDEVNPHVKATLQIKLVERIVEEISNRRNNKPGFTKVDSALGLYASNSMKAILSRKNTGKGLYIVGKHEIIHHSFNLLSSSKQQEVVNWYKGLNTVELLKIFRSPQSLLYYKKYYKNNDLEMANETVTWLITNKVDPSISIPRRIYNFLLDAIQKFIVILNKVRGKTKGNKPEVERKVEEIFKDVFNQIGGEHFRRSDLFLKELGNREKIVSVNEEYVQSKKERFMAMSVKKDSSMELFLSFFEEAQKKPISADQRNTIKTMAEKPQAKRDIIESIEAMDGLGVTTKDNLRKDINFITKLIGEGRDFYLSNKKEFVGAETKDDISTERNQNKAKLDKKFSDTLKPFLDLSNANRVKVGEALIDGDNGRKVYSEQELTEKGFNKTQIEGYLAVRKAFDDALAVLSERMREAGIKEKEIAEFVSSKKGYIPHKWQFRFVVKERVLQLDGSYKTVSMLDYKNEKLARKARAEAVAKDIKNGVTGKQYELTTLDSIDPDFFTDQGMSFANMKTVIEKAKAPDEMKEKVIDALRNMVKEKGFGRHFIRRTGVAGYDGANDLPKVIADYFSGFTGFVTKMEAAPKYFKALEQADPRKQKQFYAWLKDSIAYEMTNTSEFNLAKSISFVYYLANDLSFIATNATQNFIIGIAELGKLPGGKYIAEIEMFKAMTNWTTQLGVSKAEKKSIGKMVEMGELGGDMAGELIGFKNNPLYRGVSAGLNKALFYSTAFSERHINRIPAFLAARRILEKSGLNGEELNARALEASKDIHFRYGKQHRPEYLRGRKGVLFVFTNYIRSFLFSLYRDIKTKEFLSVARKMFWTSFFGGASALPFAWVISAIVSALSDDDDDEELKEEATFMETTLKKGLPAALGVDISNRVAIDITGIKSAFDDPKNVIKYLGAAGGLAFNRIPKGYKYVRQGRYLEAGTQLMPDFVANVLKAYTGSKNGVRTEFGNLLADEYGNPLKYTKTEAVIKATGFSPNREQAIYERKSKEYKEEEKRSKEMEYYRVKIKIALDNNDYATAYMLKLEAMRKGLIKGGAPSVPKAPTMQNTSESRYQRFIR